MVTGPGMGGFIGRQRELEQLAAAVADLGGGRGGTLLVAGPSGMGASRLLDELESRIVERPGRPVTRLRSDQLPAWRGDPYRPVRVALEGHLRTLTPARVAALVDPAAELLGPLFAGIPGVPTVAPREADRSERRTERTLEALRALLGRLASDRPVALILEDLHEIDAATRHLMVFLARTAGHLPLLLIGTYQPDALTRAHPFRETLDAIESGPRGVTRVDVGPLGQTEVGALIEAHEGERPSAPLLLLVAERARGNPLIAEEVLAARRDLSGASLTAPLAQLILGRLGHRSAECRSVLRALAIAEGPLLPGELAAVIDAYEAGQGRKPRRSPGRNRGGNGMLDGELMAGLQEAIRERFAVALPAATSSAPTPPGTGSLVRVRHQLVAGALAADLLPDERRRMRAAVASVLSTHPAEAARHWLAAYEPARARAAALLAAEAEESAGASADALEHLELAIELAVPATHASDGGSDPLDVALLRRAAEAALAAGNPGRAAALTESTLGPAIPSGDRVATAAAWDRLGVFRWETGDREGALAAHTRALEILPRNETLERSRVLATIGQIKMLEGSFLEAERLASEALALAGASGPAGEAWLGHATCTLGVIDGWLGRPESAIARLERALAIAVRLGRLEDAFRARANLASILYIEGRREDAVRVSEAGIAAAEAAGLEAVHGNRLRGGAVDSLFMLGRWREARALAMHALEWAPAGIAFVHAAVGFITVETELSAGEEASRMLGRLLVELDLIADTQFAVPTYQAAASLALWRGDPADARRVADAAWDRVRTTEDWVLAAPTASTVLGVAAEVAEAARDRRDLGTLAAIHARAGAVLAEVEQIVDRSGVGPNVFARREVDAELATARSHLLRVNGQDDPAAWSTVAERWTTLRRPYDIARARRRQAAAILAAGKADGERREHRDEAREPLLEAATIAASLPALPLLRAVADLAARARITLPDAALEVLAASAAPVQEQAPRTVPSDLRMGRPFPVAPPPERQTAETFGLSVRERGVLAEVVAGRTNREIGERLYISEKTVGVHVGNILAKLGVSGRVEAATVALRLGLVDDLAADAKRPGRASPGLIRRGRGA
jgi:DNA-binding CsgD family transcriptional regulator/tetratricopeptide (TPR) repeat protein